MSFFDQCAQNLNDPQRQAQQFDLYYEQRCVRTVLRQTQRLDLERPLRQAAQAQWGDGYLRLALLPEVWPAFPWRLVAKRLPAEALQAHPRMLLGSVFSDFLGTPLAQVFFETHAAVAATLEQRFLGVIVPCKGLRGGLLVHHRPVPSDAVGVRWYYRLAEPVDQVMELWVEPLVAACQRLAANTGGK